MGMGLDPGAIQAVSAASGVWDEDGCLDSFIRSKLTRSQRHVAVTLATWDAVWEEYLHPKWAEQKMRLHGAQEKVLERYFKKGGWGAKAVLQARRKVVEKANSGKPTDRVPGKVVTVNEFGTSRVSSAMNSPQPCEAELDRSKPTRLEGWKPPAGSNTKERRLPRARSCETEPPRPKPSSL
ncbi:hypothetical protein HaLaN_17693 [Haematococcus lacustris]|uniref:Uncharacterized protein n=1 Tax=Haematococcus lacustris TaxID=44745 RepID=A0A699ZX70_HAELA|nr:hypothetical protein HaLaN_17693 [Haematococcus lacustris]